jgi:hypothetical protein
MILRLILMFTKIDNGIWRFCIVFVVGCLTKFEKSTMNATFHVHMQSGIECIEYRSHANSWISCRCRMLRFVWTPLVHFDQCGAHSGKKRPGNKSKCGKACIGQRCFQQWYALVWSSAAGPACLCRDIKTDMAVRDQKAQKVTKWFFRPLMAYIHVYIHTYY